MILEGIFVYSSLIRYYNNGYNSDLQKVTNESK